MEYDPSNPLEFRKAVARRLRELRPGLFVAVPNGNVLQVGHAYVCLESLTRLVEGEPSRASEHVDTFLGSLLKFHDTEVRELPLSDVLELIMPRIKPDSIFEQVDVQKVPHLRYGNNTVVSYVIDQPTWTVSIVSSQLKAWGMTVEDLHQVALLNLERSSKETEICFAEVKDGGNAAFFLGQDGYDSSRILLRDLWSQLSPELGPQFMVAVPNRDVLIGFSDRSPETRRKMLERIDESFRTKPYPITPECFICTRDGIAGTVDQEHD